MIEEEHSHGSVCQPPLHPGDGDALLLIDVQRDLLPGGLLAVPGAEAILEPANACLDLFATLGLPVFASRDWHPKQYCSFSTRGGHLPEHCVAGSEGAQFAAGLRLPANTTIVSKGVCADSDAFSAFTDSDLDLQLAALGIRRLFIAGLSPDFGVLYDVVDALGWGYHVVIVSDAVVTVDQRRGDGARVLAALQQAGVVQAGSAAITGVEPGRPARCPDAAEAHLGGVACVARRTVRQAAWPSQLLAETAEACDGGSLAAGRVLPNAWLENLCPVELLDVDLPAVLASARAGPRIRTG